MKAGIYVRVSTDKESQETSLEYQEIACRDFANANGFEVYNVYHDVFTGTKSGRYNKRNGYNKMIEDALAKNIDVIIVKDLSRLSRNSLELEFLRNRVISKNFHIVTLNGDIDSIKGNISLFSTYILIYSEESKVTSIRTKQSKKTMAKNGIFTGSIPPYGYYTIDGKLYIRDDDSPKIVKRIFNNYISGESAESIAKNLTEENIPTPSQLANKKNASSKWHATTIRKMLVNQHYIGNLVQGKTEAVNTLYKSRVNNSKDDYIVVKNTHEPIISKEQFNLVNDTIESRKPNTKVSRKTHLLSNLIYCETCGRAISLRNNNYICSGRLKHGKKVCCTKKINKIDLVNLLTKNIIEKIDNCESDFLLKYVERKLNKNISSHKSTLNNLHTEKNKLENRKKEALNMHLDGDISRDEYNMVVTESNNTIDNLLKNIRSIESMLSVKDKIDLSRDFNLLKSRITKSVSLNPEILNYFIKRIEVTKLGEPKIYYRF
ncbi:TPA: recombinase family protein [Clostridioides difficile]|nr:recombinase family protein [Clostridioides difficile]HBE9357033.1 recombinase family protein [Clostridioides difficile]